jgi:hypothetical protein
MSGENAFAMIPLKMIEPLSLAACHKLQEPKSDLFPRHAKVHCRRVCIIGRDWPSRRLKRLAKAGFLNQGLQSVMAGKTAFPESAGRQPISMARVVRQPSLPRPFHEIGSDRSFSLEVDGAARLELIPLPQPSSHSFRDLNQVG